MLAITEVKIAPAIPTPKTMPVDLAVADRAMTLRARYHIRVPDALQIATALQSSATAFVTNDLRLKKVEDLDVIVLREYL